MIKPLLQSLILILLLILLFSILGCTPQHLAAIPEEESSKENRFTVGCYVVEANAKLGLVNSGGGIEVCKLVCSKTLPKNFHYKYENRGCNAEVGSRDTGTGSYD